MREKLMRFGTAKTFNAGDVLLDNNAYIKALPIVTRGSVKVMRTNEDGKEIFLYYIKAGESCIMSFLSGIHNDTSKVKALADEETDVLFIPVRNLLELNKEYPEWLDYIFKLYHKRFEELLEVVNAVSFQNMDERLHKLLILKRTNNASSELNVTHEQLANELGTARVVVSRLLKQMEIKGLVTLGRNKITLIK